MIEQKSKALLFLNGSYPYRLPEVELYPCIYCCDGALTYLRDRQIKVDYVIGDFDSVDKSGSYDDVILVHRPDQNYTDFEKALQFILDKGHDAVDVYGASGGQQDHFMGNLSVALRYKSKLLLRFYDDEQQYFFADKSLVLKNIKGKMISLLPMPSVTMVKTEGLEYPLRGENLTFGERIGTRNRASASIVKIDYQDGNLLVFVEN